MSILEPIALLAFCVSAALLGYTFLLYPVGIAIRARLRPLPVTQADIHPTVTLFIAARNEAAHLAARLENACALTYPDLKIIVVSDGSTDGTAEIARGWPDPRVSVVAFDTPAGKTAAVARATKEAPDSEIWACTDATAQWPPDALQRLVRSFADPTVGAVSGLVVYDAPDTSIGHGFSFYQRVIVPQRMADSAVGTVTSISGSIYAIRSKLWADAPPELSYDLVHPLEVAARGYRSVLDPEAISVEQARGRASREFRSRVRLALSAYAFTAFARRRARDLPRGYRWQLWSHKVFRWFAPALTVLLLMSAVALSNSFPALARPVVAGIVAAGCLGLLGLAPGIGRLFAAPLFGLTVASAYLSAGLLYLQGMRVAGWEPGDQR